jgi:DNA-binding MarR family transcriptional regulator
MNTIGIRSRPQDICIIQVISSKHTGSRLAEIGTVGNQVGNEPGGADAVGTIELELIKLVRHLETFARRSSLYVRVDRAGYLAMRVLDDMGPVSTNALAHALHLDASTVTRQIAALERGGFIERRPDPADGRSATIALTSAGHESMRELEQERRRGIEALVRDWGGADQVGLAAGLARLNSALSNGCRCNGCH